VHLIVCDLETSKMRRSRPVLGSSGTEKKNINTANEVQSVLLYLGDNLNEP
jgi:hypothetical protein